MHSRSVLRRAIQKLAWARAKSKAKQFKSLGLYRRLAMQSGVARHAFTALREGIRMEQRELWLESEAVKTGRKRRMRRVFRAIKELVERSIAERKEFH